MSARRPNVRAALLGASYRRVLRPALFASHGGDPEAAHDQTIRLLAGFGSAGPVRALSRLLTATNGVETTVAGVRFPGRVGLAAGLDKDGRAVRAWRPLGFAFAELGTVTAQAQPGNDRPRLFRLPHERALINRMGFNNAGATALAATLSRANVYRGNLGAGLPVGVSIGKTKAVPVEQAVPDYLSSFDVVVPHADYVAVNVSSPNTPGLRDLQGAERLRELTAALVGRAGELAVRYACAPMPVFVKLAPDLSWADLDGLLAVCEQTGVAGLIATNTTLAHGGEAGGLSGRPLTARARAVVEYVVGRTRLPVIGSGGVMTADDARALLDAGAALVQLCTGFIYSGPALAMAIEAGER